MPEASRDRSLETLGRIKQTNTMPKKVFFSFHYKLDNWRVGQIRNIGAIEGSPAATDNDWETVKKGGDAAIQK